MSLKTNGKHNFLLITCMLVSLILALVINTRLHKDPIDITKQESTINFNQHMLGIVSFGNKRLLSDLIWIQTLISSDLEKYNKRDLNSWMFHRFMTIAYLDPLFYENYIYGGMYLSIVKDDLEGAASLFEKGLIVFPDDYNLNYNAGFNYYFEMGDFDRGYAILKKLEHHPKSPKFLPFILNKLRYETGESFEVLQNFLVHSLENTNDPILQRKLKSEIYSLTAQNDLECLNKYGALKCARKDAEGNPYLYRNGKWISAKPFQPYQIHRRIKDSGYQPESSK